MSGIDAIEEPVPILNEDFWSNRFHFCALEAGLRAYLEGRLHESHYVRQLTYDLYERGDYREPIPCSETLARIEVLWQSTARARSHRTDNGPESEEK